MSNQRSKIDFNGYTVIRDETDLNLASKYKAQTLFLPLSPKMGRNMKKIIWEIFKADHFVLNDCLLDN